MYVNRPMRLADYDYSQDGYYFVTSCVQNFMSVFGYIENGVMCLNLFGSIAYQQLYWLGSHYPYITIDTAVVMPNHIHCIVCIDHVGQGRDLDLPGHKIKSLSELIGAFKMRTSKFIHRNGYDDFKWQSSFYDTIITSEESLQIIRDYITCNPTNWPRDRNKP